MGLYAIEPAAARTCSRRGRLGTAVPLLQEQCEAATAELQQLSDRHALEAVPVQSAVTGARDGTFQLTTLAGSYDVLVRAGDRGTALVLDVAADYAKLELALEQNVVQGTITEAQAALPDADVTVLLPRPRVLWPAKASATGHYLVASPPTVRKVVAWACALGHQSAFEVGPMQKPRTSICLDSVS